MDGADKTIREIRTAMAENTRKPAIIPNGLNMKSGKENSFALPALPGLPV
jgi:hypothetical protein